MEGPAVAAAGVRGEGDALAMALACDAGLIGVNGGLEIIIVFIRSIARMFLATEPDWMSWTSTRGLSAGSALLCELLQGLLHRLQLSIDDGGDSLAGVRASQHCLLCADVGCGGSGCGCGLLVQRSGVIENVLHDSSLYGGLKCSDGIGLRKQRSEGRRRGCGGC